MPKTQNEINSLTVKKRRLDSLAFLIQGADPCGAVYIDNKSHIYIANNKEDNTVLIENTMKYFSDISNLSIQLLCDKINDINNTKEYMKQQIESINLPFRQNTTSRKIDQLETARDKIANSIMKSYILPNDRTVLPWYTINALQKKQYTYMDNNTKGLNGKEIHAEMKILTKLFEDNAIQSLKPGEQVYIGISKRCCANCEAVIKAVNKEFGDRIVVDVRDDGHQLHFGSGVPSFFEQSINKYNLTNEQINRMKDTVWKEMKREYSTIGDTFTSAFDHPKKDYSSQQMRKQFHTQSRSPSPDQTTNVLKALEQCYNTTITAGDHSIAGNIYRENSSIPIKAETIKQVVDMLSFDKKEIGKNVIDQVSNTAQKITRKIQIIDIINTHKILLEDASLLQKSLDYASNKLDKEIKKLNDEIIPTPAKKIKQDKAASSTDSQDNSYKNLWKNTLKEHIKNKFSKDDIKLLEGIKRSLGHGLNVDNNSNAIFNSPKRKNTIQL